MYRISKVCQDSEYFSESALVGKYVQLLIVPKVGTCQYMAFTIRCITV